MSKKTIKDGVRTRTRIMHTFTQEEFRARTLEMNRLARQAELREEERASAVATAKAEIKALETQVADMRNQLDEGGEMRDVDATVVMDRKKGVKTFYLFCPGQPGHRHRLKVENMTEEDYAALPLPEGDDTATVATGQPS